MDLMLSHISKNTPPECHIYRPVNFEQFSSLLKGVLQQGMGRDYPFALPMDKYVKSWDRKNLYDVYYVPCYEEISKVGGTSYSYNQMYSLSKPEIQIIIETL